MKNQRVAITGGAGFIGSNLAQELARENIVVIVDDLSTGREENITDLISQENVIFIRGSILDLQLIERAFSGVDFVFHQAAIPSVPRSVANPQASHEANVTGTLNVLMAARGSGIRKVVAASSSSVYGDTPTLPKREDMVPTPQSPYAVTKLAGEYYCNVFQHVYGLPTACLRYFNVFGQNQNPTSQYSAVIPKFIHLVCSGQPPTIYGDGSQSRDFTHVSNVVSANLLACSAEGVSGKVFNIACGERYTLSQLVDAINRIAGTKIEPVFAGARPGDVLHSMADITRAQQELGFRVLTRFEQGLAGFAHAGT